MKSYSQGEDISVYFVFQDDDGNVIVPTALSVRILDQDDNVISPAETVSLPVDPADEGIDILVSAEENVVGQGQPPQVVLVNPNPITDLRVVELTVSTAQGPVVLTQGYILTARSQLVILQNSFQTYWSALLRSNTMIKMDVFRDAPKSDQIAALTEAYLRITRYNFLVRYPQNFDFQATLNVRHTTQINPRLWPVMPLDQFNTYYPEVFREALRKAQVAEANALLTEDPGDERRASGIVSEKIGESTTVYLQSKKLDLGLNEATLVYLSGYITSASKLVRTL